MSISKNEENNSARSQPGNIINCFGKQVEKNKALKEYSEIIQSTEINYEVNMLNKNIIYELEKKQKKKKYYHFGMISLKIILVLCISVIDVTHIFRTLPAILKEMNDKTLSSLNEAKELVSTMDEDVNNFCEDVESINEIKDSNKGDVNNLFSYTFVNLLKKLADFDLTFETYRMNIIFIEQTLSKSTEKHDIIDKFLFLSKKQMFEAFKKSLQCLGIKNDITYTQFDPIFKYDNQLKNFNNFCDLLNSTLSKQENINKSFFSRFYSSKKNKNNYYIEILFSIFSNSDEIFDKLGYIFTLLNSYISKMNLLLTFENDNCTKFTDIIPESEAQDGNYPCYTFFSLIINKLLNNYKYKIKDSIEKPKFIEEASAYNNLLLSLVNENCYRTGYNQKEYKEKVEKNLDLCKHFVKPAVFTLFTHKKDKNGKEIIDKKGNKIKEEVEILSYEPTTETSKFPESLKKEILSDPSFIKYFDKEMCNVYKTYSDPNNSLNCDTSEGSNAVFKILQETTDQIGGKRKYTKSSKKRRIKTSKKKERKTNNKNKRKKTNKV